ncbi:hypothetical protein KKG19_05305 [Patescibacteria group bacterium]|nr:hypothetical protein [Patescibacteria group bacterium]
MPFQNRTKTEIWYICDKCKYEKEIGPNPTYSSIYECDKCSNKEAFTGKIDPVSLVVTGDKQVNPVIDKIGKVFWGVICPLAVTALVMFISYLVIMSNLPEKIANEVSKAINPELKKINQKISEIKIIRSK